MITNLGVTSMSLQFEFVCQKKKKKKRLHQINNDIGDL